MAVEEGMRHKGTRLTPRRLGALAATAVVAAVVTLVGVFYFFEPMEAADPVSAPPVPAAVGFLVYIVLSVLLLDWVNRQIGRPVKAALIIAASQIILVSVDFVLRGERGVATGAASAVLILVTWTVMGAVYGAVLPGTKSADPLPQSEDSSDRSINGNGR